MVRKRINKSKIKYKQYGDRDFFTFQAGKTIVHSAKMPIQSETGGGAGVGWKGVKGKAEKKRRFRYLTTVYEDDQLMPYSVWERKKMREILSDVRVTIAADNATSPGNVELATTSGPIINWLGLTSAKAPKTCKGCGQPVREIDSYCSSCGMKSD